MASTSSGTSSLAIASTSTTIATQTEDQVPSLTLTIPRSIKSDKTCIICNKSKNLVNVPDYAYIQTFINKNIMIPQDSKCCATHLNHKNNIHKRDINRIETVSDSISLTGLELEMIFNRIQNLTSL